MRQPVTVTRGNGDGGNGGGAVSRFMDVVYSVIFICLSCIPILVKVSARLSQ